MDRLKGLAWLFPLFRQVFTELDEISIEADAGEIESDKAFINQGVEDLLGLITSEQRRLSSDKITLKLGFEHEDGRRLYVRAETWVTDNDN